MDSTNTTDAARRDGSALERDVGRPAPERADPDYDDLLECQRCHGDGMDPWNDYLLPCPECGGREC